MWSVKPPPDQFMDPQHNAFDRWMREQVRDISGFDILEWGGEAPEFLGEWRAP